jgi:hypothetical protein
MWASFVVMMSDCSAHRCFSGVSEGSVSMGSLQDSCKTMGRGWFVVVCVCGARSSFGECGVRSAFGEWARVCVGFVLRWWVGVAMLRHDCEYNDA